MPKLLLQNVLIFSSLELHCISHCYCRSNTDDILNDFQLALELSGVEVMLLPDCIEYNFDE